MRLIIVRHGETAGNAANIVLGALDTPLNDNGIKQARKVGERLKDEKIDVIYCSDRKRARMTAEEIARFHPSVPVHYVKEIAERSYGIFEGKHRDELRKAIKESGFPKHKFKPQGGESYEEERDRVMAFLEGVKKKHKSQTVLFVTHGGVKRVMMGDLMGLAIEEFIDDWGNTSLSIVEFEEKGHKVVVLNCTKHLEV